MLHDFSWGDLRKWLFFPDREPRTDQSKQIYQRLAWWTNESLEITCRGVSKKFPTRVDKLIIDESQNSLQGG